MTQKVLLLAAQDKAGVTRSHERTANVVGALTFEELVSKLNDIFFIVSPLKILIFLRFRRVITTMNKKARNSQ